ncbi:hypothetical protein [Actinoplanes siamensis]|uniref:Uncharacterized protein n=1 Tax=Actinoplanes siamensis TaxID=1223317 RepID=A0A919N3H8_9ACTN|nr:hypothetical protein [Actinoplanes siamensis]GIF03687.1 hypothetical protein Asi03nite_12250 [Actinoplanes siamensis]
MNPGYATSVRLDRISFDEAAARIAAARTSAALSGATGLGIEPLRRLRTHGRPDYRPQNAWRLLAEFD